MAKLDLDQRRAARSEAARTPHEVTIGGETFLLRPFQPLEFVELLKTGQVADAMRLLMVNPDDWARMAAHQPDSGDLELMLEELYGTPLGEQSASTGSSPNGGPSSRPTSPPPTASTSRKPAGARKPSASDDS